MHITCISWIRDLGNMDKNITQGTCDSWWPIFLELNQTVSEPKEIVPWMFFLSQVQLHVQQEFIPVGCIPSAAMAAGVYPSDRRGGGVCRGGLPGVVCPGGCLPGGGGVYLPVNRMTDRRQ